MELHRLLQKQINKFLSEDCRNHPSFQAFAEAINESYKSFERDKDILNHAFSVNESEFKKMNADLAREYNLKKISIEKLKEGLQDITGANFMIPGGDNNDLLFIADYLNAEINKRKLVEQSLSRTLQMLTTLLSNLHSGVLVEDENRQILFTNQEFCRIFSIPVNPENMIGADCSESANQSKALFKDPEHFVSLIENTLFKREKVIGLELEMADGTILELDYVPIFINNEYKGHLWDYSNITARRQHEKELLESNQQLQVFHSLMNNTTDAIQVVTEDGNLFYINNEASRRLGISAGDIAKYAVWDIETLFKKAGAWQKHVRQLKRTGALTLEGEHTNMTTGKKFPVEVNVKYIHINGSGYVIANSRDITVRKNTERLLRAQEEKYRNIIANMNLGLLEVDMHEKIVYANLSFQNMSGYSLNDLVGKTASRLFANSDNTQLFAERNENRKKGLSDMYEVCVKNKQGRVKWWMISGAPNYNDEGVLIGSIGIHLDITEQKVLEKELEHAKLKAEEASKAKESFLANMSHEIRTPINAINGMIRELNKEDLSEKQRGYVNLSCKASAHLLSIINNILDMSKIEAGELGLEAEHFVLGQSLHKVIAMLAPKAEEKGIALKYSLSEKLREVMIGDALRIEQILINLVNNAIKFTASGGVTVTCSLLKDMRNEQEIEIAVSDTGIGMDAGYLSRIFSKFSQEDRSTSRRYGGTGLGMAITYELVQLMHGSIDVKSEKGKGTTFSVRLVLEKGAKQKLKEQHIITTEDIKGSRILLVEDNQLNRLVAMNTLKFYGCSITEAVNGNEAIEKLKNQAFDLVLMDVQMPEMDGITATKAIRNELRLAIPIVALTANAFKSEMELCRLAGMNDFVNKPFEEAVLVKTISKYVNIAAAKRSTKKIKNAPAEKDSLYDLSVLEQVSQGDKDFTHKMVGVFIEQTSEAIDLMHQAFVAGNFTEISKLAHKIRPSIDSMGIAILHDKMYQLENDCKDPLNPERTGALLEEITRTLNRVLAQLRNLLSPGL